ncbi:winged helix-turn-helix transcriptional regulator [Cryptosporangium minutisporangium]|uniref:Winged helix-turn-helix transcriptional regulator n=1 Tax=Cryptosporangium minutisporangium TaxID=113569 RepID=A0ABP6T0N2_9ACTN
MAQQRAYGQFCGLARGLEIVGERWALLIIRDLLVAPRRYTDLRRGLPRIPTNILAARLKELEAAGVVERIVLPRPDGSVVYRLTRYGTELEPVVIALSRWGARALGEPREDEILTPASVIMAMRTTFREEHARGLTVDYELRTGEIVVHLRVDDGALTAVEGASPEPDLVIEAGPAIRALLAREVTPKQAIADGTVTVTGDPGLLDRFVEVFAI